ncbi:ATP-binding cassette domain-containing protein [Microvirga sp. W0021]|uniref:ATP-binding cassette domain-containing protein n=1 Tax=Hohaiivirga grylli TaxID=3133970 RepID=A0ABV0BM13_9HYPH
MSLKVSFRHKIGEFTLDASFEVSSGFTVLTGMSGSGKTTTLNIISGLITPEYGKIAISDHIVFDSERRINQLSHKRNIGYVFQENRLFPHLSVARNLTYGRWFRRPSSKERTLQEVTELLDISHLLKRKPDTLSGGEKQRVAIGRALLSAPQLLLMDEPLSAIDQKRRQEIIPFIEAIYKETGIPVLYTTHNIAEVAHLMTDHIQLEYSSDRNGVRFMSRGNGQK